MTPPIAIVSRACLFPQSLSPQALWKNLLESRDLLSPADPERWRVEPARAMQQEGWDNPGGYVDGFDEYFDPARFELPDEWLHSMDPLVRWVLHTAHEAYHPIERAEQGNLAVILGNLSLPSEGLAAWAESIWTNSKRPHEHNRHMSGLPAHIVPRALGRVGDAFALDAACASSIYAIKLGCEKLRRKQADLVLAGAVNRADPLFLNIGFQALQALSPTGRTRPFHRRADGLVPAEGAAFVGLKRLDDALDCGDSILGVIHDAGLSNDGRSEGLLVPAGEGQVRALRAAYDHIDVDPQDVSFIECHATGTPVGDGREIKSLQRVFQPEHEIPIGSHKSNMGHAITAAGMAGLLKILGAMEHETLPATIHCDDPIDALDDSPFRLVTDAEPWREERRIAALSAFGFGGNNSHLVIEQWRGQSELFPAGAINPKSPEEVPDESIEIAVVGLGITSGVAEDVAQLQHILLDGHLDGAESPLEEIPFNVEDMRFPPRDLAQSLPQQLAILRAACDAIDQYGRDDLEREKTGVFIGMQTDPEIVRHGLRARLSGDPKAQERVADPLTAAAVIGALPNIVTNRINSHFDLGGTSFSTNAEEHSGDIALREAVEAIRRGELDTAVVGAVEMATDAAQRTAAGNTTCVTDAALALVVERKDRAIESGHTILATIDDPARLAEADVDATCLKTPSAHSATGLFQIAAAVAVPEFALPRTGPARGIQAETAIRTDALEAPPRVTTLRRHTRPILLDTPRIHRVNHGKRKATIVAATDEELRQKSERFRQFLNNQSPCGEGIYPHEEPLGGETAQVFTGAAAAYHGMGRAICLGMPHLVDDLARRFQNLDVATRWMFHPDADAEPTPLDKLFASSVLSQLHSDLTTNLLDISFDAAIGFSSGETNALFATGVWRDFDGLFDDFTDQRVFTKYLGGSFDQLRHAWSEHLGHDEAPTWESWRLTGPREDVEDAIADEALVHLLLINAPDDVTIGGHAPAVQRVLDSLPDHGRSHLDYDIAVHCPEVEGFREPWIDVHTRNTHPTDLRIYGHAFGTHYEATTEKVAEALFGQALKTVDFPALIRSAWDDGVRVFVEHGPRTTLTPWIRQILSDRPHRVVSLDSSGDKTLRTVANAIAKLSAWGVDVDIDAFNDHVKTHSAKPREKSERTMRFPAHRPPLTIPKPLSGDAQLTIMPPAPTLPKVQEPLVFRRPAPPAQPVASSSENHLPDYFRLQHQAFERYLGMAQTRSDVHREFIARSRRAWELFRDGETGDERQEPLFDREDLKVHASGDISEIFGALFARQAFYPRQVRMPEPPLLLTDRVIDIDAEPGIVGRGTIWTETDITADSWYLFNGHIPPGVMIEAGQADLFLISWMGADFENQGQRIYRLLGCELTYRGGLPTAGETLEYDIHIDGHASQGLVRLFFFHYDCRTDGDLRLSVRNGQAGFFSDEELANSMGVLWRPQAADFRDDVQLDPPLVDLDSIPESLGADAIKRFADGDVSSCFTAGYERLLTHTRTPNIHHAEMCLAGDVEALDVKGGPFGRGYMRTRYKLSPDDWFFDGHFKNDPCMPGTLMFEGGMQVMSLYMIALGYTLDRDGWRFEPVPDVPFDLRCRGQATPTNENLVYEIFVEEVIAGPRPRLVADILATVDGLKAFHCRAMQIHLVPDTPLTETLLLHGVAQRDPRALRQGQLIHDRLAIEATGIGPASLCLGDNYARFDGPTRMPRLPGEPFQFMTRVIDADGEPGHPGPNPTATVEYDIPDDVWYFDAAGEPTMPYAVMMEAALQPCGWLSLYSGAVLQSDQELYYRNLDGAATFHREVIPDDATMTTHTRLTRNSQSGAMTIQSFEVECTIDGEPLYDLETTFGFFPKEALENQVGLPITDVERELLDAESDVFIDLKSPPDRDHPHLWPTDQLRMVDAITGRFDNGESVCWRSKKRVDPSEWFFRAHFFQDPVMPGSLGVESMLQTLRHALIFDGHHERFNNPHIEPVALESEITWTYRGQVLPANEEVTILLDLKDISTTASATTAQASATLWVDGLKIYAAERLTMRITEG